MKDTGFRRRIRERELQLVIPRLPAHGSILEVGAGAGWQARMLADRGFRVEAIDLPTSGYKSQQVFPVRDYDGIRIPFPDHHFDAVFSSNTLEHVLEVEAFSAELRRVLKTDGVAVHVLPSTAWRFWTSLTHYPFLPWHLAAALRRPFAEARAGRAGGAARTLVRGLAAALVPPRHGERGNIVSEHCLFSRRAWVGLFQRTGWRVLASAPSRLFYSGYGLLGSRLSLEARTRLSRWLGSACTIYVLEPAEPLVA